ncbi:DUF4342 domain-containing protein [Propioniciclava soli]|uniref:DUF4342 domain-containing protein n=1 Tax=Propioniciclava soli TaxID=2775081 RepID=A0ABZ3CB29_9ACTN|nr:DUF4342 domain-containing protein [Propioniciclava soli]
MNENEHPSEQFEVEGDNLLTKVRELIHEGNVRRIILKRDGDTLLEIPLQTGLAVTVLTAAMAPALVGIGAIAAVVSRVTLVVERDESAPDPAESGELPQN